MIPFGPRMWYDPSYTPRVWGPHGTSRCLARGEGTQGPQWVEPENLQPGQGVMDPTAMEVIEGDGVVDGGGKLQPVRAMLTSDGRYVVYLPEGAMNHPGILQDARTGASGVLTSPTPESIQQWRQALKEDEALILQVSDAFSRQAEGLLDVRERQKVEDLTDQVLRSLTKIREAIDHLWAAGRGDEIGEETEAYRRHATVIYGSSLPLDVRTKTPVFPGEMWHGLKAVQGFGYDELLDAHTLDGEGFHMAMSRGLDYGEFLGGLNGDNAAPSLEPVRMHTGIGNCAGATCKIFGLWPLQDGLEGDNAGVENSSLKLTRDVTEAVGAPHYIVIGPLAASLPTLAWVKENASEIGALHKRLVVRP